MKTRRNLFAALAAATATLTVTLLGAATTAQAGPPPHRKQPKQPNKPKRRD